MSCVHIFLYYISESEHKCTYIFPTQRFIKTTNYFQYKHLLSYALHLYVVTQQGTYYVGNPLIWSQDDEKKTGKKTGMVA